MRQILLIVGFMTIAANSFSQASYHTLDSLASIIRKNHNTLNGMTFSDDKESYQISFPQDNFNILASNHMAYHSVYKQENGKELLYLTENIDFAKAAYVDVGYVHNDKIVWSYKAIFPKGYLQTKVIEDGQVLRTESPDYLEFYIYVDAQKHSTTGSRRNRTNWVAIRTLGELCYLLKAEQGMISTEMAATITERFNELLDDRTKDTALRKRYLDNFPNSMYYQTVKRTYELYTVLIPTGDFISGLFQQYKYKRGLTYEEFREYNPNATNVLTVRSQTQDITTYMRDGGDVTVGPAFAMVKNGKVIYYGYYNTVTKGTSSATETEFKDWVKKIKQAVPAEVIEEKQAADYDMIQVTSPATKSYVRIFYHHYSKISKTSMLQIGFGTDL